MEIIMKGMNSKYYAIGEYNIDSGTVVVKKGSTVGEKVSDFKGTKPIVNKRKEVVKDGVVQKDIEFKSLSTAATFVTGYSTNGKRAWETKDGVKIKNLQ